MPNSRRVACGRGYKAASGRAWFINRDPIEEQGGLNLYAFVGNNGVSRWDYLGMYEVIQITSGVNYFIGDPDSSWTYGNGRWTDASGAIFSRPVADFNNTASSNVEDWFGDPNDPYRPGGAYWDTGYGAWGNVDQLDAEIASMQAMNQAVWDNIESNPVTAARNSGSGGVISVVQRLVDVLTGRDVPEGRVTLAPLDFTPQETLTPVAPMPEVTRSNLPDLDRASIAAGLASQQSTSVRANQIAALNEAARNTFDNAVFQRPVTTLATAGAQITAGVVTVYIGGPVALRGAVGAAQITRAGVPIIAGDMAGMATLGRTALVEAQAAIVGRAPYLLPVAAKVINNQATNPMGSRPSLPSEIWRQFNELFK